MIDVKEVLRRWSAGHSDRKISREAGVDRKTAARYTAVAASLFERGRELSDDEVHEVARRVQARPVAPTSTERTEVARYRPLIERWLAGDGGTRPLRLTKIHTLLVRDHGLRASYDTLWRFAHDELEWREKPATVRIDDAPPGQEAQIDFGKMGLIADDESGKKRVLWALIITLVSVRRTVWSRERDGACQRVVTVAGGPGRAAARSVRPAEAASEQRATRRGRAWRAPPA